MTEKQNESRPYAKREDVEIENLQPDPSGDITLTIKDGLFTYKLGDDTHTCAILVLGTNVSSPVDRTPLKAFKKMGKMALYSVPDVGTPLPTKVINFDNFVSGVGSHPDSRISAQGEFSIQGHKIPFTTACPTGKADHGHVIIAENEKFQKSMDNIMHITGNEDAEKLYLELKNSDLSYFSDRNVFAKKDIRVREFQQIATGEAAIRKDILMFKPFKKFLPIIGMHLSPLRNTKQTRDLSFLMASRSLLGRKEITVHADAASTYPGINVGKEEDADVVLKFVIPPEFDEFKYLIKYFQHRKSQDKPFCMRLQLSPQVTWNKIHEKFPFLSYFRTGYLAGPYFGVFWNGEHEKTPSPFTKMSILLSTETQIARYYIAKDVLRRTVSCNFTKSVMAFSICTAQEKGQKRQYMPLEDFVLNATEQPEIEMAADYEFDVIEEPAKPLPVAQREKAVVSKAGPANLSPPQEPPNNTTFKFGTDLKVDFSPKAGSSETNVEGGDNDAVASDDESDLESYPPKGKKV